MSKRQLFSASIILILLCALAFFFLIGSQSTQAPQEKPQPSSALTPEQAALIALTNFPQGQAELITLEQEHQHYLYAVTINDQGDRYRVEIALPDGNIIATKPIDDTKQPLLSLNGIFTLVQNHYPAAVFQQIALHNEQGVTYYEIIGSQDDFTLTLVMDPINGTILSQTKTPKNAGSNDSSLITALAFLQQTYPDAFPVSLNYDAKQSQYYCTLLNEDYRCDVTFTPQEITKETITPLADDDPSRRFLRRGFTHPPAVDVPPE